MKIISCITIVLLLSIGLIMYESPIEDNNQEKISEVYSNLKNSNIETIRPLQEHWENGIEGKSKGQSLFISAYNNLEVVANINNNLCHFYRGNEKQLSWVLTAIVSENLIPIKISGTPTSVTHGLCEINVLARTIDGGGLVYVTRSGDIANDPLNTFKWEVKNNYVSDITGIVGNPSIIRRNQPGNTNIEFIVPIGPNYDLYHFYPNGNKFVKSENPVCSQAVAASLIENTNGNLEAVVMHTDGTLRHYWRNEGDYVWYGPTATIDNGVSSKPGFIQNPNGNLEVVYMKNNSLYHAFRNGQNQWLVAKEFAKNYDHGVRPSPSLVFNSKFNDLEIVTNEGKLFSYWYRNNDKWNKSGNYFYSGNKTDIYIQAHDNIVSLDDRICMDNADIRVANWNGYWQRNFINEYSWINPEGIQQFNDTDDSYSEDWPRKLIMRSYNLRFPAFHEVSWNAFEFTGVDIRENTNLFQRGENPSHYGATVFQLTNEAAGFQIHSDFLGYYQENYIPRDSGHSKTTIDSVGGAHVSYATTTELKPWEYNENAKIYFEFYNKINHYYRSYENDLDNNGEPENIEAYFVGALSISDTISNKMFQWIFFTWHSDISKARRSLGKDLGTSMINVYSFFGDVPENNDRIFDEDGNVERLYNKAFTTTLPYSETLYEGTPDPGMWRFYSLYISWDHVKSMLDTYDPEGTLVSKNRSDYKIVYFTLGPELVIPDLPPSDGHVNLTQLGCGIKDLRVYIAE